ncbi:MAG: TetR/AcrR family transcriptional regulator [Spirochaetes bacterium]|nr:MAG: TetR/AcrR family transcriptional regulator [Spirochaetota bacterium]
MRKNNRERILDTARSLLPRYGYSGISIRAIAARARLTTGAIYFHFASKRDIYKTICYEAIDLLLTRFREGIAGRSTPNQKLISIYDSYIEFFHRHRDYYNILMEYKAHYGSQESGSDEIARKFTELTRVTEETISLGISENRIRAIDPLMLSVFLAAVTEGMLQYKKLGLLDALDITDERFRGFMAEIVDRGIHI